jgi:ABC-type dipeptide/oligopeptide/nickel transport system permease component
MLPNIYTISEQAKNLIQSKLNTEYIKFLKLKGLSSKKIFFKHILVTSIVPLISSFFSTIVSLMASLTVIESAFSLAGIAHTLNSLILRREYNGILFLSMLFAVMNVLAKNIEDLILKKMDPTIKM